MSEHPFEHPSKHRSEPPSGRASGSTPQDAPTQAVPTYPGAATSPPASSAGIPPAAAPTPSPGPATVTYLPAPTGPNWGLVVVGLLFVAIAAGVTANQVSGFQLSQLSETGPSVLVAVGLVCALVGIAGILARRRRG